MMASIYFSPAQIHGIERVGDIFIPGDEVLPRFSECGFVEHIDRMLAFLPASDVKMLQLLMNLMRFMPTWGIHLLLKLTLKDRYFPGAVGANLRKLDIGLRGIVFSLYYSLLDDAADSTRRIIEGIRWDGAIHSKPEESDDLPALIKAANPLKDVKT